MLRVAARALCRQTGLANGQARAFAVVAQANEGGYATFNPEDIKTIHDWPKPTPYQEELLNKMRAYGPATKESIMAKFDVVEKTCTDPEELAAFRGWKSAYLAEAGRTELDLGDLGKLKLDEPVQEFDYAAWKGKTVFPDYVDVVKKFYDGCEPEMLELMKFRMLYGTNPDVYGYLEWVEQQRAGAEKMRPAVEKFLKTVESENARIDAMLTRIQNDEEVTIGEWIDFREPKVNYDEMEKGIKGFLAEITAESSPTRPVPQWVKDEAASQLEVIAELKKLPSYNERLNEKVRSGEWY